MRESHSLGNVAPPPNCVQLNAGGKNASDSAKNTAGLYRPTSSPRNSSVKIAPALSERLAGIVRNTHWTISLTVTRRQPVPPKVAAQEHMQNSLREIVRPVRGSSLVRSRSKQHSSARSGWL